MRTFCTDLETMDDEEQLAYLTKQNEEAKKMVNDLMEAARLTMTSIKAAHKPVPKVDFTKRSDDVEGIHI